MTKILIEKFFNKECSAEEAASVADYLKTHPEVLEKYLSGKEWDTAAGQKMSEAFWSESWKKVQRGKTAGARLMVIKKIAAAAAIVITAGIVYSTFMPEHRRPSPTGVHVEPVLVQKNVTVNNTAKTMRIVLPDSSYVTLSPGGFLSYPVPFEKNKRDITLDGEARFTVRKNSVQPFTVYAGGLATTALGTAFTINTNHRMQNKVSVALHTGKVVITAFGDMRKLWKENVYLEPGQQLNVDTKTMTAVVDRIGTENMLAKQARKKRSAPVAAAGLSFVNASLPDVMNKLSAYYHRKIGFDSAALNEMNFTGTISEKDSLQIVLKVIAQMNDLEMTSAGDGYEIRRTGK